MLRCTSFLQKCHAQVASSPGLVPSCRPRPKNRERGLVAFPSQNFEEPIRLQNDTMRNVIQSHAHEAKSADYAIYRDGVVCVSSGFAHLGLWEISGRLKSESAFLPIRVIETNSPIICWHWLGSRSTETIYRNLCIDSSSGKI